MYVYEVVFEIVQFKPAKEIIGCRTIAVYSSFDSAVMSIKDRDPIEDAGYFTGISGLKVNFDNHSRHGNDFVVSVYYGNHIFGRYFVREYKLQD